MSEPPAKRRVVIVGGGLAGLSAAEALATAGGGSFDVTVIEAKRTPGGRAGSFQDPASGDTVDYCQHVAMGCCTNLLGLLRRCGLADGLRRYQELTFVHSRFPPSRFAASRLLPPPLHLAAAVGRLRFLSPAQRRQIRRGLWRLMRTDPGQLTDQPARQWLARNGQEADTIEHFWDLILVSALGEETDVVAMSVARKVLIDGFAAARGASDLWIPRVTLSDLFGRGLCDAVVRAGVTVCCDRAARRARLCDDGSIEVEFSGGDRRRCDHLVAAVPWYRISALLQDASIRSHLPQLVACRRFRSSPITGIHLWLDRQITDRPHSVLVGTLSQWLFRQPVEEGPEDGFYYQVVISASRDLRSMTRGQLIERVWGELRALFPTAVEARILRARVVTDPQSVFSVSPQVEAARPTARTALPCLHLAGDWIATGWPATMEGAVIGGRMAAASVMQSEDGPDIPIHPGLSPGWLAKWMIRY